MSGIVAATPQGPAVSYVSEADLQAGMAELARIYGWRANREVVIPGWGRLDLVLHATDADDYAAVIEFKLELTQLSKIRRAFQQADGYHRWLVANSGVSRQVILAATAIDERLVDQVAEHYAATVTPMYSGQVINFITGSHGLAQRMPRALKVQKDAAETLALATQATERMEASK